MSVCPRDGKGIGGQGVGLQGPRGPRSRPTGSQRVKMWAYWDPGCQGVGLQGPRGSRGHLCDPIGPSGWFDDS